MSGVDQQGATVGGGLAHRVPDLGALELLLAVARLGSLGGAAREVGITQPAASSRIRSMERQLGVALVDRSPRGSRLTDAGALVTGEVVGQVASQTLENMATIASVTTLPILRPLVGMDKDEITLEAQRLGSYPISIIPDQDCCTLFTPRHPVTRAKKSDVEAAEAGLDISAMVSEAVAATAMEEFDYP